MLSRRSTPLAPLRRGLLIVATTLATALGGACADEDVPGMQAGAPGLQVGAVKPNICADGATTFGIDVSKWQGAINWGQVKGAGVKFAFIRASHGLHIIDERFAANWAGAGGQGILRGVYQFFSADQDPVAQANLILAKLAEHGHGEFPPVLDVEITDGQSPATIASKVGQWMNRMEGQLGVVPIIYTGSYFWEDHVGSAAFADHPLWIAHWGTNCPSIPNQWSDWVFHQYSSTGSVAGISGAVDLNRFNGSLAALQALAADPECLTSPQHEACEGDVMVQCNNDNRLTRGDCGAFGGRCGATGGALHCVHFQCWSNLDGAEDGTLCANASTLGTCARGEYTETACGQGEQCQEGPTGARCVEGGCAGLGEGGGACVGGTRVATCSGGSYAEVDCAASGRVCSEGAGFPRCVDPQCAATRGAPENGSFCAGDHAIGTCTDGSYGARSCSAGERCVDDGGAPRCVDDGGPGGDDVSTPVDEAPADADVAGPETGPDGDDADASGETATGDGADGGISWSVRERVASLESRRFDGEGCASSGPASPPWPTALITGLGLLALVAHRRRFSRAR